jgi:ribosome maturation factor RimP
VGLSRELEDRIAREIDVLGYELIKIETFFLGRRTVLRIFIDRPDGGVTIDDCVRATKALSLVLDGEETMPGPYNLEISSPGLERPLTKPEHFGRFLGERARVEFLGEGEGRATSIGAITSASGTSITISVEGTEHTIPFERILKASLHPEDERVSKPEPAKGKKRGRHSGKRL